MSSGVSKAPRAQEPPGGSEPPRAARRWLVPPAPTHARGQLEGISVLRELPDEPGGLLWQMLRSVTLWARVPPERRPGLFNEGVDQQRREEIGRMGIPELRGPLDRMVGLLQAPDSVDGGEIAGACLAVAGWAARSGAPATQLEFLVAAALAAPGDPVLALGAARAYRDRGDRGNHVHAEAWYQRSVALARLARAWDAYARAYIGLGKMRLIQERAQEARRNFEKALRAARRNGLREVQGMALHDLFSIAAHREDYAAALEAAEGAMRAYGAGHRLLPSLAHDVARFWLARGRPGLALQVLQAVIPKVAAQRRALAMGSLGLAAARVGEREMFRDALREVEALPGDEPEKAEALVSLARGALELGLHDHAHEIIRLGREIARDRAEQHVLEELDQLHSTPRESAPAEVVSAGAEGESVRLANDLVAFLAASAPAGVPA